MNIDFYKYSGTGNDFIIIDDRLNTFDLSDEILIKSLAIGAVLKDEIKIDLGESDGFAIISKGF